MLTQASQSFQTSPKKGLKRLTSFFQSFSSKSVSSSKVSRSRFSSSTSLSSMVESDTATLVESKLDSSKTSFSQSNDNILYSKESKSLPRQSKSKRLRKSIHQDTWRRSNRTFSIIGDQLISSLQEPKISLPQPFQEFSFQTPEIPSFLEVPLPLMGSPQASPARSEFSSESYDSAELRSIVDRFPMTPCSIPSPRLRCQYSLGPINQIYS
jgi:hypothetical protein